MLQSMDWRRLTIWNRDQAPHVSREREREKEMAVKKTNGRERWLLKTSRERERDGCKKQMRERGGC